jgi:pimeloyl-ACP methyl ester carboxylesterase
MEAWDPVAEQLADRHRVLAYDLRGHGRSGDAGPAGRQLYAHGRDLAAVLGAVVGNGGSALVVGHGFGGGIVLSRAASADERIAGVVLAGSDGSAATVPGSTPDGASSRTTPVPRSTWPAVLRAVAVASRLGSWEAVADRFVRRAWVAPDEPVELTERVQADSPDSRPDARSPQVAGLPLARRVTVPVLVLRGTADLEVRPEAIEGLRTDLPHGTLVQVPMAGHMLPLTHGHLVAEEIARWGRLFGVASNRWPVVRRHTGGETISASGR